MTKQYQILTNKIITYETLEIFNTKKETFFILLFSHSKYISNCNTAKKDKGENVLDQIL
jgi:2-C-methyl-D-erythritol 4-phosphate cytidylyltransferase